MERVAICDLLKLIDPDRSNNLNEAKVMLKSMRNFNYCDFGQRQ